MSNLFTDPQALLQELQQFRADWQRSLTHLQNVPAVEVIHCQHREIFHQDKLRLLHFPATAPANSQTPLLICYSLVNRWYMIDLEPQTSLLARLLAQGIEVYVIDWGYPDLSDQQLDLDDYINGYLHQCVQEVTRHSGQPQVNLLGICQGGTFSLCYSALYPEQVKNLVTLVTPVDFHSADNHLSALIRPLDSALMAATYGNIPGIWLNGCYQALMPMRLGVQKYLHMPRQLADPQQALRFLRMEKWLHDNPDLAGQAFSEFVRWFFQENRLITNRLSIAGQPVRLAAIQQPLLNIYAQHDHLVPPSASQSLARMVASQDTHTLAMTAGHIGVFVSQKACQPLAHTLASWLHQRD